MREETRQRRHTAIAAAAYELLAQKGYDGASMLSIAKAAKASNETLYKWYGDKQGLFQALVRDNAAQTEQVLKEAIEGDTDPMKSLQEIAPLFLGMLLGDRAVLLNRAAAAEPSGELGSALSAGGREIVQPLFGNLIAQATGTQGAQAAQLTAHFLGLLVGDLQIKRVIGVQNALTKSEIDTQASTALLAFAKLV
ncbi:TetR/AcrR family transcriptional regulator [uncultured Sulfitobacter sp.]|uniref:TetR/AcrR family transcriptional regulator n=1 Tax=uncultured Sulfitobacter sp. TaxID=191468 RepID=UPI00262FF212|nr:TetR/AcrR family transcriptional regulator [uncultured Sulfitobacter sp.]